MQASPEDYPLGLVPSYLGTQGSEGNAAPPAHAGCPICGSTRGRLSPAGDDRRCDCCGSFAADRIMHAVLTNDLRDEVDLAGARAMLVAVSDCQASHVFAGAELYRCDSAEGPAADLIADPSQLASLPDTCFDVVVVSARFAVRDDLEAALSELHRILMPGGWMIAPAPESVGVRHNLTSGLESRFALRPFRGADPATRRTGEVQLAQKEAAPLKAQPPAPPELTGYAYHLSRKTGSRIVFCIDGPLSAGDRLPVKSINDETVGHVTVGLYNGGRAAPPEPWSEGLRLPPRATFELDPSLPSGVYALDGKIPFVHRSGGPTSVAILIPSNTATAFNDAGGRSLYDTPDGPSADVLSFHRPLKPSVLLERTWPFVKWFAAASPVPDETTYLIDSDLEEPDTLDGVEVLIVIGRSEYWTRRMREHFDAYVDRGGRALLLCSELMYWQVRVDLATHRMYRYKEADPHPDPLLRTTVWHHPSLEYPIYPRTGCELCHGGFSADREGIGWGGMRIVCPESPLLADTGLKGGDVVGLPDASVWDGAPVEHQADGLIKVDFGDSPPWRHEIIGYNLVRPLEDDKAPSDSATSLWLVLLRTPESGTIIHCGSLGWCGPCAVGLRNQNSTRIRAIILQMLTVLYDDSWSFSDEISRY
ncbi:MAG TPA: N,N-dimethylformamidase beta subunit family domain-containing protein [Solirubrobacterales bacterium]